MADIHVDNAGSNTSPYETWAKAATTLATAAGADAAGDAIYVASTHSESAYAAATTFAWAGSNTSPSKIIVGTTAASPPTTSGTGVVISTGAGAYNISNTGSFYMYGLIFKSGVGGSSIANILCGATAACIQRYESCEFWIATTNANSSILIGTDGLSSASYIEWRDCNVKFAATGQFIQPSQGRWVWDGGSVISGSSAAATLVKLTSGRGGSVMISGVDLSNLGSTLNLFDVGASTVPMVAVIRNCKLPASWSGNLITGTFQGQGNRVEMYNCDSTDTNYRLWVEDYAGSIKHETTIVKSSGASDGTTSLAWKMVTSANAEYPTIILRSPEIVQWNDTTGASKTVTVEIVHDSQGSGTSSAFTDKEIWLEVMYLGTSGVPLGTWIDDAAADPLVTAADQTSSSVTWTTTGLTTPVKQKLSVTFTPQEKGFIHARVCMAGASDICYVDPVMTVS